MRKGKEIDLLLAIRAKARSAVLASYPTDTVSGSPANFPDGADGVPVVDLTVEIVPVQEGSDDPSPENIRPISGWTGLTLSQSGADTSDTEELTISWEDEAGTVYGGTLDVTTGLLTVKYKKYPITANTYILNGPLESYTSVYVYRNNALGALIEPNTRTDVTKALCNVLKPVSRNQAVTTSGVFQYHASDGDQLRFGFPKTEAYATAENVYSAFSENPIEVAIPLKEPETFQLTPVQVRTLLGENNLWADTGDVTVEYRADLEKYIEKKIGEG